jgi:hypothetical protein
MFPRRFRASGSSRFLRTCTGLNSADEAQQSVENRKRMRWTTRDIQIDTKHIIRAVQNVLVIAKWTTGDRARANCDYYLRIGYSVVSGLQRQAHVHRHWTGNQKAVRVPRRGYELNSEAAQIKYYCVQHVDVRFASIASARTDLPKL